MSDFGLTQDQIDSMLSSVAGADPAAGASSALQSLADFERQTMANMPSVLNALMGFDYHLSGVECARTNPAELATLLADELVFCVPINAGMALKHYLVFDQTFAKTVAASLTGLEASAGLTLGPMELSAIVEVVSQVNGTYLTNLSRALGLNISGEAVSQTDTEAAAAELDASAVLASLSLEQGGGESAIVQHLMPGQLVERIMQKLTEAAAAPPPVTVAAAVGAAPAPPAPAEQFGAPPPLPSGSLVGGPPMASVQYSPAAFSQLVPPASSVEPRNLDILLDVPLQVTVELGKTAIPIRQILEYGQGSLITLDKLAGEPIDLLVNGKYFAKGEVVVIDENFGVRITSILSPADRLAQLT